MKDEHDRSRFSVLGSSFFLPRFSIPANMTARGFIIRGKLYRRACSLGPVFQRLLFLSWLFQAELFMPLLSQNAALGFAGNRNRAPVVLAGKSLSHEQAFFSETCWFFRVCRHGFLYRQGPGPGA